MARRRWRPDAEPPGPPASPEEQEKRAREIVLRQLTMMARSRHQLAEKLRTAGIREEIISSVLDRFTEVGLVDDAAYAEAVVRGGRESRSLSVRALKMELAKKGVDAETAQEALAGITSTDEEEVARRFAEKKARATVGLERAVRERRIAGALARKGFSAGISYRVMREVLEADEAEAEPFAD